MLKKNFTFFVPIFITILFQNLNLTIDSVMINNYNSRGTEVIGIAGSIINILGPIFFAIVIGINSYNVQYYAKKEYDILKKFTGIILLIIIPFSLLMFLILSIFDKQILSILVDINSDIGILVLTYFSIIKFDLLIIPLELMFTYQFRTLKLPKISLRVVFCQIFLNIIFNFLLIYYFNLGFFGAGLATIISKLICLFITYKYAIYIKSPFIGTFKELFTIDHKLIKRVIYTILPLISVEFMFGLSRFLTTKVYLLTGLAGYGAYVIANRIMMNFNGLVIAPANVCGIIMGEGIVLDDKKQMKKRIKSLIYFLLIIIGCLLLITIIAPIFIKLFNTTNDIKLITQCIYLLGIYMMLRIPVASIISVLKAGGDNRFVLFLDGGLTLFVIVPLMFYLQYKYNFNISLLMMITILDMFLKLVIGLLRLKQGKWNNKL